MSGAKLIANFEWFSIDLNLDLERRVCLSIKERQWIFSRQHQKEMHQCAFSSFLVFLSKNRVESLGQKRWSGEVTRIFSQKWLFGQKWHFATKNAFSARNAFSNRYAFSARNDFLAKNSFSARYGYLEKNLGQKWQWIRIELISYFLVRMAFKSEMTFLPEKDFRPESVFRPEMDF